jgi:hypothetical protein
MSKLSIYETGWINLVFENKNKEYGAYQLRKESVRTTLLAFFMGLLLLASAISIALFVKHFRPENRVDIPIPDLTRTIIQLSDIIPVEIKKTVLPAVNHPKTEAIITKDQLVNPVIVRADQAIADIARNKEITNTSIASTNGTTIGGTVTTSSGTGPETDIIADKGNEIVTSVALDKLPEFPGGINKFYTYVGNNFEKPEMEGTTMKVYVSFVIEKDGSMTDIQVKKDPGYGLGKEAIRVLKSLKTKWSPGMIGSKPVRTSYNLPIIIQMD